MRNIILSTLCAGLVTVVGCSSHQTKAVVGTQDRASQQMINELKNGVAIYFDKNSSQIEPKYHMHLAAAAKGLAQNKNLILELEGHTDSTGSVAANKRVSLERANAVRNKLVMEYHVDPSQIVTLGAGSLKPIDSNNTAEGRANNRRVTATLKIR